MLFVQHSIRRAALIAAVFANFLCFAQEQFHLRDGDRVVFYGDSITDQRLYTTLVETYVLTRFPQLHVAFVHSGWGGDRVTGGAGGGINMRLARDVVAYKPTVVTIMLGMNDGRYRTFNDQIASIFTNGYTEIVKRLKADLPGVRITAIEPSPYDDVTRKPTFEGGYNNVLLQYARFLRELGAKEGLTVADLNTPVTAMLRRAEAANPALAQKILPDRVHPAVAGHLIMAESLLKAWHAPEIVSNVEIDAGAHKVSSSDNTAVSGLQFGKTISWSQADRALPMPVDLTEPEIALAIHSSDFMDALNRETLKIPGLAAGKYTLHIDDEEVGTFTAGELAAGVNLAAFKTPMYAQATRVHALTMKHVNMHNTLWRSVQVPMEWDKPAGLQAAMQALDKLDTELMELQRAAALPVEHKFELVTGESAFHPLLDGKDLTGWHISQVNHHGNTGDWKVAEGVLNGGQDKPGNGGIILTDRKYRNFEVSLEINPDYGCDGGLFLRSTEKGEAYQVMIDFLDGGVVGGVYGEGLTGLPPGKQGSLPNWREAWKTGWNHLRARIEGDVPHIQVWLNGIKITDWQDSANHLPGAAVDGMVALQVHGGNRWIPGSKHRFRNVVLLELP